MYRIALVRALLVGFAGAHAPRTTGWMKPPTPTGVTAHEVVYELDGLSYTGYVAYPTEYAQESEPATVPGVLIAHQWYGLGDMEMYRAEEMASTMGYVAFALDVYGTGVRATSDDEAEALMDALLEDPEELRSRIVGGMGQLKSFDEVNVNATALTANGYCFGGLMVLELARIGTDAVAVTSFHGELGNLTAQSDDAFNVQSVSVHHAQNDFQGDTALRGLEAELEAKDVPHWSTTYYGHMEHGWTDPTQSVYSYVEAESAHASMFGLYRLLLPSN